MATKNPVQSFMVRRKSEHQERVEEAMRKGGQVVRDRPTMPTDPKERIRIVMLIVEEALELARAMGVSVAAYGQGSKIVNVENGQDYENKLTFEDAGEKYTNLVDAVDALADLSVVTYGGFGALGVAAESVLEEVDKNNLSKFEPPKCPNCQAPMEKQRVTMRASSDLPYVGLKMGDELGTVPLWVCTSAGREHEVREEKEGPWVRDDGKYMKPPYWKPPDIKRVLDAQTKTVEAVGLMAKDEQQVPVSDAPFIEGHNTAEPVPTVTPGEWLKFLKVRWCALPTKEREQVLKDVGLFAQAHQFGPAGVPLERGLALIDQINAEGYLVTLEWDLGRVERRVAVESELATCRGVWEQLCKRFWLLTPLARQAFWVEEDAVGAEDGWPAEKLKNIPPPHKRVQRKMLESYQLPSNLPRLRAYLDKAAPLPPTPVDEKGTPPPYPTPVKADSSSDPQAGGITPGATA